MDFEDLGASCNAFKKTCSLRSRQRYFSYIHIYVHTYTLSFTSHGKYVVLSTCCCHVQLFSRPKKFQTAMLGEQETSGKTVEQDQAQSN